MSMVTFDKLVYVDTLTRSGVPEGQARAQADALDVALRDTVATKADVAGLEVVIAKQKADILKWMFGALLVQTAVIAALVKLF